LLQTTRELKATIDRIPRVKLVNLPTPLQEMPRLTKILKGPRLWIKRDDCTGLAFGGNKERKTEFVMADVLRGKADVVITTGPIQSNHSRATAAAAKKLGLRVVLVLTGEKPRIHDGNLLLDHLLGAEIRFFHGDEASWERARPMEKIADELKSKGHAPYVIPGGASYPVGAVAYANAMLELLTQAKEINLGINYILHAAGSGGTQAGLILANKALRSNVNIIGVCVEPDNGWLAKKTVQIANDTAKLLKLKETVTPNDVIIKNYAGPGYGKLSHEAKEAIKLMAETEGILLDPVYTSKALAGLIDMIRCERFKKDDNVVLIHTGGTPALFPYRSELI
jgi:L-cysteate sulfo-lyase